jgi:hypothetical protein
LSKTAKGNGGIEQFNGREAKTAALLLRCPLNLRLTLAVSPSRHLNRSTFTPTLTV